MQRFFPLNRRSLFQLKTLYKTPYVLIILILTLYSCKNEDPELTINYDNQIAALNLEPLPLVNHPVDNNSTQAKIDLGKLLFWDPIISGKKDVACATCHHPNHGYSDGLDLPIGVNGSGLGPNRTENTGGLGIISERVPRNSPSILNAAYNGMTTLGNYVPENGIMFWDGRMLSLESQCQGPPTSAAEMRGDAYHEDDVFDSIMNRLKAIPEYVSLFNNAFGGGSSAVTQENYAKAISSFERTIVTNNSNYLQYLNGNLSALSVKEKKGLLLFFGKANCNNCHTGPMFSDFNFHTLGVVDNPAHPKGTDKGKDDLYKFRTPTLHNVAITGPYMHNGMISSLEEAVEFMSSGTSRNGNVNSAMIDPNFKPVNLSIEEKESIVAFLKSLTDEDFDKEIPNKVPSGLKVGGNI